MDTSINKTTGLIIGAAIKIHTEVGPGLLESAYSFCLEHELQKMGMLVEKQLPVPLIYKEVKLDMGYRLDLLIDKKVIVEIKSVEALCDVHTAQLLTYLKLANIKVGLLINFNVVRLKTGITRLISKDPIL